MGVTTESVKTDLSTAQLAGIGAAALLWNEVEFMLDCALYSGEGLPPSCLADDLPKRPLDEKIEDARKAAIHWRLPDDFMDAITSTAASFRDLKILRNAIIHARLYNRDLGIGRFISRKGKSFDVLLTESALEWLYRNLLVLRRELRALVAIFDLVRTTKLAERAGLIASGQIDPMPEAREWLERMAKCKAERFDLGPAPKFPS